MLQPKVLFEAYTYNSGVGKGDSKGRAELATPQLGEALTFGLSICKKIIRKNAPNELFLVFYEKKRRISHGA